MCQPSFNSASATANITRDGVSWWSKSVEARNDAPPVQGVFLIVPALSHASHE